MHQKTAFILILSLGLIAVAADKNADREQGYSVAQSLAIHQVPNGVEGELQVLVDKRLTGSVWEKLWGNGDWSFVFPPDSDVHKEFSAHPPLKSRLCIKDRAGKMVAERHLETALAKLESWNVASEANQLFLLTEDYTAGAGSYNGLGTTLLMVSDSSLQDVKALNTASHEEEPIRLVKSLKSDWRITSRNSGGEILSFACHPKSDGNFVIDYVRYSSDGTRWLEHKRESDGFWESDQPFPERSAFP